ncbi:OmpA family protein [Flavobacterium rhizosphaerae]|uniref:OmpA family protein n=1 Tax=Flavobacterium rhizosphaerae TaxID=3163298 RepID=A0ABW8YWQ7_9FLAO
MKKLYIFVLLFTAAVHAQQTFTVYFDLDKDEVNADSYNALQQWMQNNKDVTVFKIAAFTDSRGTDYYNRALSARRAANVEKLLQQNGVLFSEAYTATGLGEIAGGDYDKNRKAVISFIVRQVLVEEESEALAPKNEEREVNNTISEAIKSKGTGKTIVLKNLNFYGNSGIVLPKSKPVLLELLKVMEDNPNLKIDIQGHICCLRKDKDNIALLRAKSVYKFLVDNNIDKSRLTYKSFEGKHPIYPIPEKTHEEEVANRRVEIEIISE